MKISARRATWSKRYQLALRRYVRSFNKEGLARAAKLGGQAVGLGLDTLSMARIHHQILSELGIADLNAKAGAKAITYANRFFTESIIPLENTHQAALKTETLVKNRTRVLHKRISEAAASRRQLDRGIGRRRVAETALQATRLQHRKLLADSRRLRHQLRDQMRRILTVQEKRRATISLQLHNEIAQTLVGIQLRFLALDTVARGNMESLKNVVVETERLMKQSTKIIKRLAYECGIGKKT